MNLDSAMCSAEEEDKSENKIIVYTIDGSSIYKRKNRPRYVGYY